MGANCATLKGTGQPSSEWHLPLMAPRLFLPPRMARPACGACRSKKPARRTLSERDKAGDAARLLALLQDAELTAVALQRMDGYTIDEIAQKLGYPRVRSSASYA